MKDKIFIIRPDDSLIGLKEWQELYGLKVGSLQIGKYFWASEYKFKQDLRIYGKLYVSEILMRVADAVREEWGPLTVNSFNRNTAKQLILRASGARAATTSPHVVYLAMDVDTTSAADTVKLAALFLTVARRLDIKIRVGFEDYLKDGNTFVHFDVCPEYYGDGRPRHGQPHPAVWERAYLTW